MEGATTPEAGRRTRAALAEIPARLDRLRVTSSPLQPLTNIQERSPAIPASYLSPAPSPDERVISQRGRKRLPVTWSPDIELKRNSSFHSLVRTPPKETASRYSPTKLGVTLRPSSRKRLILDDTERIPLTPEKIDFSDISTPQKLKITSPIKETPSNKRCKIEKKLNAKFIGSLDSALKGLSPTQLMNMIKHIVANHPEMETEIKNEFPEPDLGPLEENLRYLKSNIYKSLPTSRLISKTDCPAYSRVVTHLSAFKMYLVEQGKILMESQLWGSVIQYVFMSWTYVRATPVWDNQQHNAQRKQCFKALTSFCMSALKKGEHSILELMDIQDKLQSMTADSDEIQSCLKYVQGLLKNSI